MESRLLRDLRARREAEEAAYGFVEDLLDALELPEVRDVIADIVTRAAQVDKPSTPSPRTASSTRTQLPARGRRRR